MKNKWVIGGLIVAGAGLAVYFAVTFLLDVPTGAFADAIGRRLAFVLGCALRCLAFGLYYLLATRGPWRMSALQVEPA